MEFNLGNRSLLVEEIGLIDRVNATLQASAQRHGITLKPRAVIELHTTYVHGNPVYRAAPAGQEPVDIPLA